MEMIKVRTSGDFMLVDPSNSKEIVSHEAREVPKTHFVIERLEAGQLIDEGSAGEVKQSTTGEDRVLDDTQHNPKEKDVDQEAGQLGDDSTLVQHGAPAPAEGSEDTAKASAQKKGRK